MTRKLLVAGSHHLLAVAFCARRLESARVQVHWRVTGGDDADARELGDAVRSELRRRADGQHRARARDDAGARLHVTAGTPQGGAPPPADEAWFFVGAHGAGADAMEDFGVVLEAAAAGGCRAVHVVREGGGPWPTASRARLVAECTARGVALRELVLPLVAGAWSSRLEAASGRFARFLWTVQELVDEIDARCADYFEHQAIRCRVPAGAVVELLDVGDAVDELLRTSREDRGAGRGHAMAGHAGGRRTIGGRAVEIGTLLEQVGRACGIGLLAAEDDAPGTEVDRLLHDRLGEWLVPGTFAAPSAANAVAAPAFDDLLSTIRARHEEVRRARDARIAEGAALSERRLALGGHTLAYYVAGEEHAETVVFINALGQGLAFWYRLLDEVTRRRRLIVWRLRGLEPDSPALRTQDHVEDLEAILRAEGVDACHLVGWCTGAKVAVELYLRQPDRVASLGFLNATFKDSAAAAEGETPYEQNLVELCRAVDEHPVLAGALRRSLLGGGEPADDAPDDGDADALALRALTDVPRELRPHVLEPFRTEASTIAYAKQVLDFVGCDVLSRASEVTAPVLVICCEQDAVTSPSRARRAAAVFPRGRHVEVRGATHYCLYERPHVIAGLLEELFGLGRRHSACGRGSAFGSGHAVVGGPTDARSATADGRSPTAASLAEARTWT